MIRESAETILAGLFTITVNSVIGSVSCPGGYTNIVVPNSPTQNMKEIDNGKKRAPYPQIMIHKEP